MCGWLITANGSGIALSVVAFEKQQYQLTTKVYYMQQVEGTSSSHNSGNAMLAPVADREGCFNALIAKRFYNSYDVFQHPPEFYSCDDDRYAWKIHIVKWNTRSTRMTVLWARFDEKKGWIFSKKPGLRRTPHGEKMR